MTAKHYLEIKNPKYCPIRHPYCSAKGDECICREKRWTCLDDDKFPSWCPLKKVEE